jgi:adenine phosphoribosyltransferase
VLGGAVAPQIGCGVSLVRKPGKLPYQRHSLDYALEYGTGTLEMHVDAIRPGERVLVLDDVLATGGTAAAAGQLVQKQGGQVIEYAFLIELGFLDGRKRLGASPIYSILRY